MELVWNMGSKLRRLSLGVVGFYLSVLTLLTIPHLQNQAFYLHRVTLTWFKNLEVPEQFGFLPNQVTSFFIPTSDGESLHAWHIVPLEVYRRDEERLLQEPHHTAEDITNRASFKLLRDDPNALLVISYHGTSGTIGSGWRPDGYRAMYSGASAKIHILCIGYRGFGLSSGSPTEAGLLKDGFAAVEWAMHVAQIPPSKIVIFGQSLGTAVSIGVTRHFALQKRPILFAGIILVAPFSDAASLLSTYRIGGVIPVLSPLARFPLLFNFFVGYVKSTWLSKDRIEDLIRAYGNSSQQFHITFVHAQDDTDIPCSHTDVLFARAIQATLPATESAECIDTFTNKTDLGPGGHILQRVTRHGTIRKELIMYGVHDRIMAHPAVGLAILRAFGTEP